MPSRAARKRFSSISSMAGSSVPGRSGRSSSSRASDWTSAARAPTSSTRRLRIHDADLDGAVARLQPDVPPQQRGIGDRARAQQRVDGPDPVGVAAKGRGTPVRGKASKSGGAGRREARGPALPERGVGRQREQQRQVRAQAVEQPDRGARASRSRRGRASRGSARGARARASTRRCRGSADETRRRCRSTPPTGACRRRRRAALAGQRARHLAAQLGELRDRVGDPAMHPGGDLHHGRVGLRRHAIAQLGRQVGDHLVRAEGQRPVARDRGA